MLETLTHLPKQAGVYQYFDANHRLLYVGKAKNLYNRVRSYFSFTPTLRPNERLSPRIYRMISQSVRIETIVVASEHDALILENSLIKQLAPKYNILMRDDKTYPYIVIDTSQDFPRLEITRRIDKAKHLHYFGPFSSGARDILDAIYEVVPLVQKANCLKGKKACLFYQIQKCPAPCENRITPQAYAVHIEEAKRLLFDKKKLIDIVKTKMHSYAQDLRFEEANVCKNQIATIQKSQIATVLDMASHDDYDIFAIAIEGSVACAVRMFMREGKIVDATHTLLRNSEGFDAQELYARTLIDFYLSHDTIVPHTILVSESFEDAPLIAQHLQSQSGHTVAIVTPQKGDKMRIIELAMSNAYTLLGQQRKSSSSQESLLQAVQSLFNLSKLPHRIEIFDNSHLQGVAKVGAMVVWEGENFDKKSYRHYHLEAFDEYGQMRELLTRRIESFAKEPPPDAWLIDGGETLLLLARNLLEMHGVTLDVIAIAKAKVDAKAHRAKGKAHDILWGSDEAFKLATSDTRLQFLQKLRDEAHRFAITFHKKSKLKLDQESQLLQIKGIGPAKIKKLLNAFGSFEAIRKATLEELQLHLNVDDALLVFTRYNSGA
ncbi:MAG: excinuclease ABC subunit C [Sulfuricurvum sp. PC08-66]|nr:MAG: excinuclease ABC subunit C [Sulfuricurvum sp. PC08-66]